MRNLNHILACNHDIPPKKIVPYNTKGTRTFFLDLSNQFFCLEVVSFSVVRKEETIPENIKFIFPLPFLLRMSSPFDGGKERNNNFCGYVFSIMCSTLVLLHCQNFCIVLNFDEKHCRRASL